MPRKFKVFLGGKELITPFDYPNMDSTAVEWTEESVPEYCTKEQIGKEYFFEGDMDKVYVCMINQNGELAFSFEPYWALASELPCANGIYPEIVWCDE